MSSTDKEKEQIPRALPKSSWVPQIPCVLLSDTIIKNILFILKKSLCSRWEHKTNQSNFYFSLPQLFLIGNEA